jgi:hypothetical protein
VCIKVNIKNQEIYIITYYNPPNRKDIDKNLFEYIENNYKNYIICGDFNAKHIDFGCKINNKNGVILNDFINASIAIILNKKNEFTYIREKTKYQEILDIFIRSSSLYTSISECCAYYESELHRDHIPVNLKMNNINEFEKIENCIEEQLKYSKANWNLFKEQLDLIDTSAIIKSNNANEINEFLTKSMINAAKRAIPVKTNNLKSNKRPAGSNWY